MAPTMITSAFSNSSGSPLFTRIQGEGPHTVLCLHSSTGSHAQWRGLAQALAEHARVVSPDFHAHGRSPAWPSEAPSTLQVDAHGAALAWREAAPEADSVHLVAHSYGAAIALQMALEHPASVRSLTLYEPVAFGLLHGAAAAGRALAEIESIADEVALRTAQGDRAGAAEAFVDYWGGAGAWRRMGEPQRDAVQVRITAIPRHFAGLFRARWSGQELATLRMPILLMHGGRTRDSARRVADLLAGALPQARRHEFADAGHLGPMTHEDAVNGQILAHLRACGVLPAESGVATPGAAQPAQEPA
jgi:pimeloyl-ACP methyl ester carboxylesterase